MKLSTIYKTLTLKSCIIGGYAPGVLYPSNTTALNYICIVKFISRIIL